MPTPVSTLIDALFSCSLKTSRGNEPVTATFVMITPGDVTVHEAAARRQLLECISKTQEAIGVILADSWLSTPVVSMKYNNHCTLSK
jgi:hypothetical protein